MEKQYPVITISREYAAYGRTVAAGIEKELGITYYDRDFVRETAKQSGYSEEEIWKEGESMSPGSKFLNDLLNNANSYTSPYDAIYKAQKQVILELVEKGPCIIVGRCSDHILREAGIKTFDVFLFADTEHRVKRAMELEENSGKDEKEVRKVLERVDSFRNIYYKKYTGKEMGYYKNYNISLDTGRIGVENCVKIICDLAKEA